MLRGWNRVLIVDTSQMPVRHNVRETGFFHLSAKMSSSRFMPALHHSYRALSGAWASGAQHDQRRKYQNRAPTWLDVMTSLAGRNLDLVQVMVRSLSDTHPRDDIILWLLEQGSPPDRSRRLRFSARRWAM